MHLSYTFDDLVNIMNEDSGIETNVAIKTESDISKEFLNEFEPMADLSSSAASSDNSDSTSNFDDFLSSHFIGPVYDDLELGNTIDSLFAQTVALEEENSSLFLKKDCMWGGLCNELLKPGRGDVDCPCDRSVAKFINGIIIGKPDIFMTQSVLKPFRNAGVPVIDMLTPNVPIFESEEDRSRINSAKLANKFSLQSLREEERALHHFNRLKSVNIEEDEDEEDESEEEEEDDDESEEETAPQQVLQYLESSGDMCEFNRLRTIEATLNDHSYFHRGQISTLSELGIETPSDSEEEIDVVSVSDKKYPVGTRLGFIPPTNPPNGARCNIQRYNQNNNNNSTTNNNNINGRNNNNALKAKMPAKRSRTTATKNYPPAKRKAVAAPANENKPARARQTRTNNSAGRRRKNYRDNDSENDQNPLEKRSLHNDMERQRRVGLRNDFENLRRLVPIVSNNEKAPKVSILREASKYCKKLAKTSEDMEEELEKLHEYQAYLQMKVSRLRRQQALENGTISSEDCEEFDQY